MRMRTLPSNVHRESWKSSFVKRATRASMRASHPEMVTFFSSVKFLRRLPSRLSP
jgi:hypothetical protein